MLGPVTAAHLKNSFWGKGHQKRKRRHACPKCCCLPKINQSVADADSKLAEVGKKSVECSNQLRSPIIYPSPPPPPPPALLAPFCVLSGLLTVQEFFDENPRLDEGSRKLSGLVKDHINPKSWEGDYNPTGVDLQLCWKTGAQLAAAALTEHMLFNADEFNFEVMAAAGATLLSPFPGEGRLGVKVGLRAREAQ